MDSQGQTEALGESWKYDADYHRAADFLGISVYDRQDHKTAQKIATLSDWASHKTGKSDITSVLTEVAKLQKSIGYNGIGKSLVDQLYQNVRISQDSERIKTKDEKEVKAKPKEKGSPIQKVVAETVNAVVGQTVNEMVKKALADKKVIQGAVAQSVGQAMKGALK